jgi:hypothetical protein
MKIVLSLLILSMILLLQSCSPTVGSAAWHQRANNVDLTNYYTEMCLGFGYKSETPELRQCVQTETRLGIDRADAQWSQMIDSFQKMGNQKKKIRTNCTSYGNDIDCTSSY